VVKTGLNLHAGTAVSEIRAKSTHYRLTDENETKFYGLSRFDQSFLSGQRDEYFIPVDLFLRPWEAGRFR
jgi:hypothetical protein